MGQEAQRLAGLRFARSLLAGDLGYVSVSSSSSN